MTRSKSSLHRVFNILLMPHAFLVFNFRAKFGAAEYMVLEAIIFETVCVYISGHKEECQKKRPSSCT